MKKIHDEKIVMSKFPSLERVYRKSHIKTRQNPFKFL